MNDPITNTEIIRWIVGGIAVNFVGIVGSYVNIVQRIAVLETKIKIFMGLTKRADDRRADEE